MACLILGGRCRGKSTEYLLCEVMRQGENKVRIPDLRPRATQGLDCSPSQAYLGALTREKMATRTIAVNREAITLTELKSVKYAMTSANR